MLGLTSFIDKISRSCNNNIQDPLDRYVVCGACDGGGVCGAGCIDVNHKCVIVAGDVSESKTDRTRERPRGLDTLILVVSLRYHCTSTRPFLPFHLFSVI